MADNSSSDPKGGLILIADDEPTVRDVAARILKYGGYEVVSAVNGKDCVEQFKTRPDEIALVVLDMTMPVMGGLEAFRELRRIRPDVRVLISSGYSEVDSDDNLAGEGVAGFIQKPFRIEELLKTVKNIVHAA